MTRILFVMTNLRSGGIATSLLNLLNHISEDSSFEIDLLLFSTRAGMMERIPENICLLEGKRVLQCLSDGQSEIMDDYKLLGYFRMLLAGVSRVIGHELPYKIINCLAGKINKEYDYAISTTQSSPRKHLYGGCNEFILQNVKARNYISFIHCDYLSYGLNDKHTNAVYRKMDKIAVVSESCKKAFLTACPDLETKTEVVYNCCQYETILEYANCETVRYNKNKINFITVARLGVEKGHIRTLEILYELKKQGYEFVWHVVGDGHEQIRASMQSLIEKYDLTDVVILYGNQANPYRYMKNCDFILLPSFHEAAPMVFEEAAILGIPILTTETLSAKELVQTSGIGYVCENSKEGLRSGIQMFLKQPAYLERIRKHLKLRSRTNDKALEGFYHLINHED